MPKAYDFQTIIMKLQEFWASQGCLIWQPYYVQVGAGTMNPGTALRVLGPEPWRVAYVEPSIRPDDGRYGENPNRMQMHYQMQVILKPDPGNPQEIYLGSLQALGIDPRQHDIRFVEDNWKSPALAAWGLGWEVWMDGQEITQFTYFQQSGGQTLNPVSVELTYGLERIAIALQQVNSFRDIQWSAQLTDGDVNLQAEQEHSRYYFEIADVEHLRQMYDLFETEAKACLQQRLVLPAHDYVLKCSHTFNILDTRGAIGVTERQAYFARMRDLSRAVAEAYIEQRQALEFPWLDDESAQAGAQPSAAQSRPALSVHAQADTLLFEIGTEELPVADLDTSLEAIRQLAPSMLDGLRLDYESLQVLGTPRRLVLIVENLAPTQRDLEQVVKGPPAERAFDSDGAPTKAAQGFARSKGVQIGELEVREIDGGRYVTAVVRENGRPAVEVLAEALPDLIAGLRFEQSMRWNDTNVAFSRPIRWLLALYGDQVVPFAYAGLESGKLTRGLRFNDPAEFPIDNTRDYMEQMQAQGILLDFEERRANIRSQVETLATQVGGIIPEDPRLLDEVTNLVEAPAALLGSFDPEHLALPREVLISVMKKHQRYFPVQKKDRLLPYFITVANKPSLGPNKCEGAETIIDGNEHVVRARFTDAAYFVRQDLKNPLADYLPRLDTLTFQTKLGSMLDKTGRIRKLVEDLIPMFDLDESQAKVARRAAELCKADLVTSMVVEMTSLQGVMGSHYALTSGEPKPVALAIYDHYLPRFAGDQTAQTRPGLVIGLADRLDTLTGLFAAGLAPTGNKDPFAQRRAALGLVQNLLTWDLDFDIDAAIGMAAIHQPIETDENVESEVAEFIIERLRNILLDDGWRYDIVDAVLSAQGSNPAAALRAVRELNTWVERPEWDEILPAYARCVRITRDLGTIYDLDPNGFTETASQDLYAALIGAERAERVPGSVDDFLNAFTPMIPAINRFFDKVLVMAEEKSVRHNRLALLQRIAALAQSAADMSRLEGF